MVGLAAAGSKFLLDGIVAFEAVLCHVDALGKILETAHDELNRKDVVIIVIDYQSFVAAAHLVYPAAVAHDEWSLETQFHFLG